MLGADIRMIEPLRFLARQLDDLLGTRRKFIHDFPLSPIPRAEGCRL